MQVLCTEGAERGGLLCRPAMSPECCRGSLPLVAALVTVSLLLAVRGMLQLGAPYVQVGAIPPVAPYEAMGVLLLLDGIDRGLNGSNVEILSADLVLWTSAPCRLVGSLRLLSERKAAEGAGMGREVQSGLRQMWL